jgi:diaminohydroxyphosphoribosylaminopyrimidine deaminase/5-amino-6-(5-phosphoribosylamino)uracil reductase
VNLAALLAEFGRRKWTHVFVEGGSRLLGGLADALLIDEWHAFVAPKIVGGAALSPVGGAGLDAIPQAPTLRVMSTRMIDGDVYIHGRTVR